MRVDGVPSVRVCMEPVREGAQVHAQNVLGSLEHDLLAAVDHFGGPFTPVGFYYRTMIRPRSLWPLYEKFLRNVAGLGRLDKHAGRSRRFDTEHRRAEVLVIGGGRAGREAARSAAAAGKQVVLVNERGAPGTNGDYEVLAPARAIGIYEGGLVPVDAGSVLYRFRAERIVVATGALEQPLLFPGNDLVGVYLPGAVRRLVDEWSLKPGARAVIVSADERGLAVAEQLERAGTSVVARIDLRTEPPRQIAARGHRGRLSSVVVDGSELECDLLVMSGGRQPAYSLLAQAGARIEYDAERGIFVPSDLPPNVEAVGSVAGELEPAAVPAASFNGADEVGRCFVCVCEDVTEKDMKRAIAEGFDSIELAKRYTTVTMGPCQGRLCHVPAIRLFAREHETDEATIGTTTARPPWAPVSLGLLAGRGHEPAKRTSIHHRHEEAGATMMWTGHWRRAHSYEHAGNEALNVHRTVGVIDVSTLGKLLVQGPDAARFLELLYPNRFGDMKIGRIRYGVLGTDAGRIMDDGTIARLGEEHLRHDHLHRRRHGDRVVRMVERRLGAGRRDRQPHRVPRRSERRGAAGEGAPGQARRRRHSNEGISYLDAKESFVAGVPACSCASASSASSATSSTSPSPYGEHSGTPCSSRRRPRDPSVRARAPAHSAAREDAHHRRAGHRFRVERCSRPACPGSPSSTRTTSSASGRSSTFRSAASVSSSSASR